MNLNSWGNNFTEFKSEKLAEWRITPKCGFNVPHSDSGQILSCGMRFIPASTKHLYNMYAMLAQRRRRWADVV